jgi:methionyl-tRNA formyltransferase
MLEKLIDVNAHIVGVITKKESAFNTDFEDLAPLAQSNNIPYCYVREINEGMTIGWIEELRPDIIFCFGWSNLLKKEILNIRRVGVIGFHPTLLPMNRGRHPLIWAKVLGLKKSGTTFFFMDEGADTGDILDQKEFEILPGDTAADLYQKMITNAETQIENFYPKLINGDYSRTKQKTYKGNIWRKRVEMDGLIDFRMDTESICNLIRGLSKPYIGAHLVYNGGEIKVWEAKSVEVNKNNLEPGKVLESSKDEILIKTKDGAVLISCQGLMPIPKVGSYIL